MFFSEMDFPLQIATVIASVFLIISLALAFWLIVKGPTVFERILAMDFMGGICLVLLILFAIAFDQGVLLDAAFAIALVSFLGTVAFAKYMERGGD